MSMSQSCPLNHHYKASHLPLLVRTQHTFSGISLLWPLMPDRAIKLFSASPKTLPLRFNLVQRWDLGYNSPTFQGSSSDSPKMYISAQAHHSMTFCCTHSQSQGPVHSTCLGTLPSLSLGHILLIFPVFFTGRLPLPPAQVKPLCSMLLHWTLSSFSPHLNCLLPAPWHLVYGHSTLWSWSISQPWGRAGGWAAGLQEGWL